MSPKRESDGPDSEREEEPFLLRFSPALFALLLPLPFPFPFVLLFLFVRRRLLGVALAPPDAAAFFLVVVFFLFVAVFFLVFLLAVVFFRFVAFLVVPDEVEATGRSVPAVRRLRCRIDRSSLSENIVLGANSSSKSSALFSSSGTMKLRSPSSSSPSSSSSSMKSRRPSSLSSSGSGSPVRRRFRARLPLDEDSALLCRLKGRLLP